MDILVVDQLSESWWLLGQSTATVMHLGVGRDALKPHQSEERQENEGGEDLVLARRWLPDNGRN